MQEGVGEGLAVVTPDEWQSSPALWGAAAQAPMLLVGCSAAEYRAITRRRELPPVLARVNGRAWLAAPGRPGVRVSVLGHG
jgi:S-DNA-T family DNA segregation ATPase FtsK/SpoIIIE